MKKKTKDTLVLATAFAAILGSAAIASSGDQKVVSYADKDKYENCVPATTIRSIAFKCDAK